MRDSRQFIQVSQLYLFLRYIYVNRRIDLLGEIMKTDMKKDAMLHLRVSSAALEKIKQFADDKGLSQSEFCLNAILAAIGEDLEKPVIDNVLTRLAVLEANMYQRLTVIESQLHHQSSVH
jgi:uncharacterized protein (DUF1778 family)